LLCCVQTEDGMSEAVDALATAIVELVEARDWVTFAELARLVPGFQVEDPRGPCWALDKGDLLVWQGMTREGKDALIAVLEGHQVCAAQCSMLSYVVDGLVLNGVPAWVPMALRPKRCANRRPAKGVEGGWLCYVDEKAPRGRTGKMGKRARVH
jgi:hypothetical protein